jgi:hypothetical protein
MHKLFMIEAFMRNFFFDCCFNFNSEVTFNLFHSLLHKSIFLQSLYLSIKVILRAYVADESSTWNNCLLVPNAILLLEQPVSPLRKIREI